MLQLMLRRCRDIYRLNIENGLSFKQKSNNQYVVYSIYFWGMSPINNYR